MEVYEQLEFVINRIKFFRTQKKISQLQLANSARISQGFLTDIETGKKQPSVMSLLKIANALEISPKDFFPEVSHKDKNQIKSDIIGLLEQL